MTLLLQTAPTFARAESLEIKLAADRAELDAALRLRFEVFNLELRAGLAASYARGYDTDAYDAYCDHLIARDTASGEVVGTYRLLRQRVAERHIGFYSENEFDLTNLRRLPGELLELGRSCVARSHRSASVIARLWRAIIEYARERDIRWLFGCGSLPATDAAEVQRLYAYLRDHHSAPAEYRVAPHHRCRMQVSEVGAFDDARAALRQLSPVMKGYLRAGAVACGMPAYDAEFGTADVLMLMDLNRLAARYRNHYEAPESWKERAA